MRIGTGRLFRGERAIRAYRLMGRAFQRAYALVDRLGLPTLRRRRSDHAVCFCYHNVVPDAIAGGVGDQSLHIGRTVFASHLDWIKVAFDVVPLGELVDRLARGRSLKGLACLTFDDGYRGVFQHALPALARLGLPATIFVVTDAVGSGEPFWWDRLGLMGPLEGGVRLHCRDALSGDTRMIGEEFPGTPRVPGDLLPASWDVVLQSVGPLCSIGSHSASHRNLTRLGGADLVDDLARSRTTLAERMADWTELVSYPYGCTNGAVAAAARAVGYRGGLALSFGSVARQSDPYRIARINVPSGLGVETLSCWSAGLRWNPPR